MSTTVKRTLSKSGTFFVTKIKRDALNLSKKVVAAAAAGVSAVAVTTFAAAYFDYDVSPVTATAIAGGVTWLAQTVAGYWKSETHRDPVTERTASAAVLGDDGVDLPGPDHRA